MTELPKSQRAEEAMIAAILRDPGIAPEVFNVLPEASAVYFAPYRLIYDRLIESHYADEPMDALWITEALGQKLAKAWRLPEKEIADRLAELASNSGASAVQAADYARIVKRHSDYRALALLADRAKAAVINEDGDPAAIAGELSAAATLIATDQAAMNETLSYRDLGRRWVIRMKEQVLLRRAGIELGAYFNLDFIDDFVKGLRATELWMLGGEPGVGKALSIDTPLPTPEGWTTMGAVVPGDVVFDETGKPCKVLGTSEVQFDREVFDVIFSDGATVRADAEHLWVTNDRRHRVSRPRRRRLPRGVTFVPKLGKYIAQVGAADKSQTHYCGLYDSPETADVAVSAKRRELGMREHGNVDAEPITTIEIARTLRVGVDARLNHSVDLAKPLTLPVADLPIDPYVLGAWLGDGNAGNGGMTTADPQIVEEIEGAGYQVTAHVGRYHFGVLGLHKPLRLAGLLGNKHIPQDYLRASEAQRRDLLAGLMDTDGTNCGPKPRSTCNFDTTSPALRDGVFELVVSLGYRPTLREGRAVVNGKDCGPKWTVTFSVPDSAPFRLKRKIALWKPATVRAERRYIVDVRNVPTEPVKCIKVSSASGLFLAGKQMIPTHNSAVIQIAAENFARRQMQKPDKRVATLMLSMEMGEEPNSTRLAQRVGKIDGDRLREAKISDRELFSTAQAWAQDQDMPLHINHASLLRESQMRALVAEEVRRNNVGLLIIDHFRMIEPDNPNLSRNDADDQIVKFLKMGLAKDMNLAVICLAHTIKGIERQDKRPRLADLRGSGAIAAFADFVSFVFRPWPYATDAEREQDLVKKTEAEMIWAKSRHSSEGTGEFFMNLAQMHVR